MNEKGLLSEEQPEFLGNCRHCGLSMHRIDGKIVGEFDCLRGHIHRLESRANHAKRKEAKEAVERLLDAMMRGKV